MWTILPLLIVAIVGFTAAQTDLTSDGNYSDCASNLATLESALYGVKTNLFELNRIFYPPSLLPTRFVRVTYTFFDMKTGCEHCTNVTYIWAIGEVLFLQPPTLFKLNSLFFYFPNNELITLSLKLPIECIQLIDGVCSCKNDSQMLDILTQQLDIYAKFTNQQNIERSNTFSRAVCAEELYDTYYSGKDNFTYIIVGAAYVGPIVLVLVTISVISIVLKVYKFQKKKEKGIILQNIKSKNLAALVSIGVYVSIYILILDILAVNIVRTSDHEYEEELAGFHPSNLVATYVTLCCDLLMVFILFSLLISVGIIRLQQHCCSHENQTTICCKKYTDDEVNGVVHSIFSLLLVPPCLIVASHFGYIILAWITEPSRSTTTLVLYYFLFFYLFLVFQKCYKLGIKCSKCSKCSKYCNRNNGASTANGTLLASAVRDTPPGIDVEANNSSDVPEIYFTVFCMNTLFGMLYLGVAVIFVMVIYLRPLASEDLFNYLYNVIQFMIVVISTQFAYRLLVGKKFSIKKVTKVIRKAIKEKVKDKNRSLVEETGQFIASEILTPLLNKLEQPQEKTTDPKPQNIQ